MFVADDHGRYDTGCYGNELVRTPTIDRFASEGMKFNQAFTASPVCGPSRATLYTGLYPYRNGAYHQHSAVRPGVKGLPHHLRPLGYRVALTGKADIRPDAAFPFEYINKDAAAGEVDGAESFLGKAGKDPFCLVVASHWPHRPFAQKAGQIRYDPGHVKIPPYLVDTPETRADMARNYAAVQALDERFNTVLNTLKRFGMEDNTLVIYTVDHGQSYPFSKWTCYEAGLHNPFIARWPGRIKPGSVSDAMMSFVDVVPTLIDVAGGQPAEDLDGRSFRPVLEGEKLEHRDAVFGTYTHAGVLNAHGDFPIRSVHTRTHHYIRNLTPDRTFTNNLTASAEDIRFWKSWVEKAQSDPFAASRVNLYQHRPAEELFDLRTDPWSLKNIAGDSTARETLDGMRKQVDDWMKQQGDPGKPDDASRKQERGKREKQL